MINISDDGAIINFPCVPNLRTIDVTPVDCEVSCTPARCFPTPELYIIITEMKKA